MINHHSENSIDETILLEKKSHNGSLTSPSSSSNIYFTQDTENAIIDFLNSTDQSERNIIYNGRIRYAFYKLAENIIHTF